MKKYLAPLLLLFTSQLCPAAWINADDFAIGTDVSNIDSKFTLSFLEKKYGLIDDEKSPLTISPPLSETEYGINNFFGKGSYNLGTIPFPPPDLNNINSSYMGILIEAISPFESISMRINSNSGGPNSIIMFDDNGEYISYHYFGGQQRVLDSEGGFLYNTQEYKYTFTDKNISTILIGAWDSSTFYYGLDVEVNEPRLFPLFLLVLFLIYLTRLKKIE